MENVSERSSDLDIPQNGSTLFNSSTGFRNLFSSLQPGTVLTIGTDSGNFFGPAQFVSFNQSTGIISITESAGITPVGTSTILIDVNKVETVTFTS
ncbi:hypothetical protein [Bacillus sp. NPDC077027]|uniref:hypothetical protein n=1 Tax=Bacillus sp. NPDC077027 TaxID=3390548 RepID=UPI003CFF8A78